MEQNLPVITKKVWSFVRVIFFMLKKGIAKRKLLTDLSMMMKGGKLAGKARRAATFDHLSFPTPPSGEYEFSCRNTPPYPLSLFSSHKKNKNNCHHRVANPNPPLAVDDCDDIVIDPAVIKVLDMLTSTAAMPGVERSPIVEQMRITDSPFPGTYGGEDGPVDEAADKFIRRFYSDLRREN